MPECKNSENYTELQSGKKYNVFEKTEDTLVFSGWFVCLTSGRGPQAYLTFRLDKPDPLGPDDFIEGSKPPTCSLPMYGMMITSGEEGEQYEVIKAYRVGSSAGLDEGVEYRYCPVEGGRRRKRKTRRRRSGTRRR